VPGLTNFFTVVPLDDVFLVEGPTALFVVLFVLDVLLEELFGVDDVFKLLRPREGVPVAEIGAVNGRGMSLNGTFTLPPPPSIGWDPFTSARAAKAAGGSSPFFLGTNDIIISSTCLS